MCHGFPSITGLPSLSRGSSIIFFKQFMASFFSDYGKYEQSIETSTDPKDHDGV